MRKLSLIFFTLIITSPVFVLMFLSFQDNSVSTVIEISDITEEFYILGPGDKEIRLPNFLYSRQDAQQVCVNSGGESFNQPADDSTWCVVRDVEEKEFIITLRCPLLLLDTEVPSLEFDCTDELKQCKDLGGDSVFKTLDGGKILDSELLCSL
jgi:hypothetical protein